MNSMLQEYKNEEFQIRTLNEDGTIWFVAKDVAQALEYKEASLNQTNNLFKAVPDIWADHKRIMVRSENGVEQEREMLCLTEQGVYFFLGRSDKPKALPYQMWIAGEVVPSIRQAGSYSVKPEKELKALNVRAAEVLQRLALQVTSKSEREVINREAFRFVTGREMPEEARIEDKKHNPRYWTAQQIGKVLKWPLDAVMHRAEKLGITKKAVNGCWDGDEWKFTKEGRQKFLDLVSKGVMKIEGGYEYYENGYKRIHWRFDPDAARI